MPPVASRVVTIITTFEARELVLSGFAELGVRKYSVFNVEGMGAHGQRRSGLTATKNLMYVIVASESLSGKVLEWVEHNLLPHNSSIAYSVDGVAVAAGPIK